MTAIEHPGNELSLPTEESIEQLFAESESVTALIYVFPERLVECFHTGDKGAAPSLLNKDSVSRELALSTLSSFRNQIAFRQKAISETTSIVNFDFLGDMPGPLTAEWMKRAGSKHPVKAAEEFNAVFAPYYHHVQGYCGWLLQQEEYWRDLKAVVDLFSDNFDGELLPQQVFGAVPGADLVEEPKPSTSALKEFCGKWRLQGMATLDLPVPMQPQLTQTSLYTPNSSPVSVTPFLPDIFPMDPGGAIAGALDNARLGIEAPHLDEWKAMIAIGSRKKQEIYPYARQFCLQHYWRVLLHRYPEQTRKRKPIIDEAFCRYFDVGIAAIRRDRKKIASLIDRDLSTFL